MVEFQAAGETYTAYRHYKSIAASKKVVPISDGTAGETRIAVRNDVFHIQQTGTVHSLEAAARELWRLGSTLPVVYDPKNPKHAYVEHVVSTTGVAGVVLLCVGVGLLVLAALGVVLF